MWYWGSFTQQRGFELSLGSGYLETTYRLALREYSDGLVRRPAAEWTAAKLHSELSNVTCHLYGLEEVDGKENDDEFADVSLLLLHTSKFLLGSGHFWSQSCQRENSARETFYTYGPQNSTVWYYHAMSCHAIPNQSKPKTYDLSRYVEKPN